MFLKKNVKIASSSDVYFARMFRACCGRRRIPRVSRHRQRRAQSSTLRQQKDRGRGCEATAERAPFSTMFDGARCCWGHAAPTTISGNPKIPAIPPRDARLPVRVAHDRCAVAPAVISDEVVSHAVISRCVIRGAVIG
jgi:hypothetical protein